jgi:hypothetical protein
MRTITVRLLPTLGLIALSGCAVQTYADNSQPAVTLDDALKGTIDAMYAAHQESKLKAAELGYKKGLGLSACQVSAKFLIDVKGSSESKLSLSADTTPIKIIPIPLTASASTDTTTSDERSNTVTVLYTSKDCTSKGGGAGGGS